MRCYCSLSFRCVVLRDGPRRLCRSLTLENCRRHASIRRAQVARESRRTDRQQGSSRSPNNSAYFATVELAFLPPRRYPLSRHSSFATKNKGFLHPDRAAGQCHQNALYLNIFPDNEHLFQRKSFK